MKCRLSARRPHPDAVLVVGDDRAWDMLATPIIHSENTEPLWTRRVAGYCVYGRDYLRAAKMLKRLSASWTFSIARKAHSVAWMGIEGVELHVA